MTYSKRFRSSPIVSSITQEIQQITQNPWTIMEVCGGQTHAIVKYGIQQLLPKSIELVHGPGCPVCVTPPTVIDEAITIANHSDVILCTFGDMMRVTGDMGSLMEARSRGANVRVLYSPMDAIYIAKANPEKQVVFFGVGFETTSPANGLAVLLAAKNKLTNFSVLLSQVMVPPAIEAILNDKENRVQGFLAAGHVCTVMGYQQYHQITCQYQVPIVVTGFEPVDILSGILSCVKQLEARHIDPSVPFFVDNQYSRCVTESGNQYAQKNLSEVFEPADQVWRGMGILPQSGLTLSKKYQQWDARKRFNYQIAEAFESQECRSGDVLKGKCKPYECEAFGKTCHPENPLGPTMVSTEGACAAYYHYASHEQLA